MNGKEYGAQPAFPVETAHTCDYQGLTIRDVFAGLVVAACAVGQHQFEFEGDIPWSVRVADALCDLLAKERSDG